MGLFDKLPSGWSQAKDPQGQTYYYNRSSGETSYTKPEKKEKKGRGLPAGWAETKDASGTTYYYRYGGGLALRVDSTGGAARTATVQGYG